MATFNPIPSSAFGNIGPVSGLPTGGGNQLIGGGSITNNTGGYYNAQGQQVNQPTSPTQLTNVGAPTGNFGRGNVQIQGPNIPGPGQRGYINPNTLPGAIGPGKTGYINPNTLVQGPGGIRMGSYDPSSLSDAQRQWLWTQSGRPGTAPSDFGGGFYIPPSQQPALPPSLPALSLTTPTKGASAATAPQLPVSPGQAGVQGQPFNALTQVAQAVQGLQRATSLPISAIQSFLQNATGGIPSAGANAPQVQKTSNAPRSASDKPPVSDNSEAIDPIRRLSEQVQSFFGLSPAQQVHPVQHFSDTMQRGASQAQGAFNAKAPAGQRFADYSPTGQQQAVLGSSTVNMPGNLQGKDIPTAIMNYGSIQDPTQKSNIVAGLSTPQGLAGVHKVIDQAQKSGDTQTIHQMADLAAQVQQNLNFQAQISQYVQAISQGFGQAPSAPVTAARTPMVQQGIGQALNAPSPTQYTPQGLPGQQVSYLPPNLQSAPQTQQNRPVINPFMGNL